MLISAEDRGISLAEYQDEFYERQVAAQANLNWPILLVLEFLKQLPAGKIEGLSPEDYIKKHCIAFDAYQEMEIRDTAVLEPSIDLLLRNRDDSSVRAWALRQNKWLLDQNPPPNHEPRHEAIPPGPPPGPMPGTRENPWPAKSIYTRAQMAKRMKCSLTEVSRMEKKGSIPKLREGFFKTSGGHARGPLLAQERNQQRRPLLNPVHPWRRVNIPPLQLRPIG